MARLESGKVLADAARPELDVAAFLDGFDVADADEFLRWRERQQARLLPAILKAMVGLCGDLKVATIAEMIETQAQAERLARLGVKYGQGFLFGRPAPSPAIAGGLPRRAPPKSAVVAP